MTRSHTLSSTPVFITTVNVVIAVARGRAFVSGSTGVTTTQVSTVVRLGRFASSAMSVVGPAVVLVPTARFFSIVGDSASHDLLVNCQSVGIFHFFPGRSNSTRVTSLIGGNAPFSIVRFRHFSSRRRASRARGTQRSKYGLRRFTHGGCGDSQSATQTYTVFQGEFTLVVIAVIHDIGGDRGRRPRYCTGSSGQLKPWTEVCLYRFC